MLDDDDKAGSKHLSKTAKKKARARERRLAVVPGYISIRLDGSEFRLLRLFSRQRSNDVSCELFGASLQGPRNYHQYIALSYTWGSEDKVANIVVDDKKREVRKNLAQALSALRRDDEDLILWVDALCINQLNVSERNHQVALMAQIYQQAKEVYIYLGETSDHIGSAMQIMREARNDERDSIHLRDALKGLREMLERPWFGRVWILQEAAHASSSTIFCGAQSVSTTLFRNALDAARIKPADHLQAVLDLMQGASRKNDTKVRNEGIASLVNRFKGSEATNERDRIYALRSMSSDASASNYLRPAY
ncbi:HET-domain-containing protein, partial [Pyrenochaeta sp. DS3sAY3a]